MPEIQTYFITCVYKITFKLDFRVGDAHVHTMKEIRGSGDINPPIHNIVIKWRSLVSLMLWPLYSQGKRPLYELSSRLDGSRNQFGYIREEKFSYPCHETKL